MSISPVANRSFLHGDRKTSPASEKIIYATIDSLALKRATLPLQLLPVEDDNVTPGTANESSKKKKIGTKVDSTNPRRKQHGKYLPVLPSGKSEQKEVTVKLANVYASPIIQPQGGRKHVISFPSTLAANDKDDIDALPIRFASVPDTKCNTDLPYESHSREIECSLSTGYSLNDEDTVFPNSALANESSADDYERIESVSTAACSNVLSVENHEETVRSKKTFVKSKSTNDLTTKSTLDRFRGEKIAGSLVFGNERFTCDKKKRHFARNVLHLVPEYLAKGTKRREKAKGDLNESPSTLKALSMDPKGGINFKARYRSRSLSREELKSLKISTPTNFVHVASATNPSLLASGNAARFNLEQVVITHEEKCATLPLLAGGSDSSMDVAPGVGKGKDDAVTHRNGTFDNAKLRRELLSELRARSTKAFKLETSQQVKTNECPATVSENESPLSLSRAELRATFSFLWSNRTMGLVENDRREISGRTLNENRAEEDIDDTAEVYDDVGPLNVIGSQEDDYDDVGLRADENDSSEFSATFQDSDSIYDDVVDPSNAAPVLFADKDSGIREESSKREESGYVLVSDEYSNVDDGQDYTDEDDQDVYDDVGLPSEEQVNSLYAGSTTGSILGSTWANGKESEWEDLEDSSANSVSPLSASQNNLSTETLVAVNRKKSSQRWPRKMRRQRSKVSKRNSRSLSTSATRDSTFHVTVSLGRGSSLLVGGTEEDSEEWKRLEREDRTAQEHSQRTQGLVQIRVIDLDEDVDTQETSCYVHEDSTSDDSTYESFRSIQDDFSTASETEAVDEPVDGGGCKNAETEQTTPNRLVIEYMGAPTKPNPPPPREASLTRTLGRRIKMLRRTWSITKGSLGRMRRRTSVQDDHLCDENRESSNDHSNLDGGRYFSFARHFKKSVTGPLSTFYLNGYAANGRDDSATGTEPMYSNTNEQADHYSVLADQEPLYQFYAEAVARVASDSNSYDYEEIESTVPSRSTTDLAKPGHRTLWCQTPQVINNGFLQRLSTEEKRLQEAKFEILTSEASYLNSLRVLTNEFHNESSIGELLTQTEKDKLFAGIPNVLHASEQFLAELETLWRQDPMLQGLPDLLLKYSDKCLDVYVPYCSNQVSVGATLKDLRSRKGPKFEETISRIEAREACQSLSLHSFLMLPMQRITRLPLLADAVLSKLPTERDDKSEWERVLSNLSYIVTECNEAARAAAKEIEMETLARKLEYTVKIKPIALKGRHLVKSGPVVQLSTKADAEYKLTFGKRFNKTPLYLFLLTDYLLVAKYKSNTQDETYTVMDTCKRSLIALESLPEDSPFTGRNAMLLTLLENCTEHQVEYILTCETDTERQRWLEAVAPSKRGLIGETLYEVWDCPQVVALYSYSPNQSDELSLHPGDVINVYRKMSDGWYQGEKLLNSEQGWFPGNYTKEVASEHVRAKNLKQRHRFLTLSANPLQRKAKQQSVIH